MNDIEKNLSQLLLKEKLFIMCLNFRLLNSSQYYYRLIFIYFPTFSNLISTIRIIMIQIVIVENILLQQLKY